MVWGFNARKPWDTLDMLPIKPRFNTDVPPIKPR